MSKKLLKQLGLFILLIAIAGGILLALGKLPVQIDQVDFVAESPSEIRRVQILTPRSLGEVGEDSIFNVELALSPEERWQGLSGHKPLKDKEGMLFVFEKPDTYGFWMKDMLFPLDILWITPTPLPLNKGEDQGGGPLSIIHIERDVKPETYPKAFAPSEPALYVLEINAGLSEKNNFKIGDSVRFLK